MTFCSKCGNELLTPDADVCIKCGKFVKERSARNGLSPKIWYLISILFGIIGGIIAYVVLKDESPKLAKNCLILSIILTVVAFAIVIIVDLYIIMSMNSMMYDSKYYESNYYDYDSKSNWQTEEKLDPFADIADKVKQDNISKQLDQDTSSAQAIAAQAAAQAAAAEAAAKAADAVRLTFHIVKIPTGTASPGCEDTNSCYFPATIKISVGDTVEWDNTDTAAHTVTAGSPSDGPSGQFDSSLLMAGTSYSFKFNSTGSYDYFCMVHPWMTGSISVR